ncbi:MAG: glycosyltransferase [Xenococcaceae cyanobacterium MO_188.B19]|nr:glycosyltransferase [Xenococcaceae cyanobacterium MO_188.B19]
MILVTVGTEKFSFNRLMKWIDDLIEQNLLQPNTEEIIIQYGSCTITPKGVKNFKVLPSKEFEKIVAQARLIIAHCGEGTIDLLANIKKPFVLVPRSGEYQEHVDDHQIELAEELAKQGVSIANSCQDLVEFLANPTTTQINHSPKEYYAKASFLLQEQFGDARSSKDLVASFA